MTQKKEKKKKKISKYPKGDFSEFEEDNIARHFPLNMKIVFKGEPFSSPSVDILVQTSYKEKAFSADSVEGKFTPK